MQEVTINKQAKLSPHFSLGELTKTSVRGIDNTPSHAAVLNLKNLCENWLEGLREKASPDPSKGRGDSEAPIIINSG